MRRSTSLFVLATVACVATPVFAGPLGYAFFVREQSGYRVVDVVYTFSDGSSFNLNNNGRVMSISDAAISGTYIQDSAISNGGFKPDATSNTRSSANDSFLTIGGFSQGGQYYGSGSTQSGSFGTGGWNSSGTTIPNGAGWITQNNTINMYAESLANFSGTRIDTSPLVAASNYGVWIAHLVMDLSQTSFTWGMTISGLNEQGGGFVRTNVPGTVNLVPTSVPGTGLAAIGTLGLAGFARRRRR